MMTIVRTRRPWFTSGRLVFAVLLLSVGSSAMLMFIGAETTVVACVASAQ